MENNGVTVLLIEDEPIAQHVETALILEAGYKIDVANSGKEALEKTARNSYDLIFMDIGLPDTSGLALTETIRTKEGPNRDTPIVGLTAHKDNAHHNQASWVGMNDYLEKPLTLEKLQRVMNLQVHNREQEHEPPKHRL